VDFSSDAIVEILWVLVGQRSSANKGDFSSASRTSGGLMRGTSDITADSGLGQVCQASQLYFIVNIVLLLSVTKSPGPRGQLSHRPIPRSACCTKVRGGYTRRVTRLSFEFRHLILWLTRRLLVRVCQVVQCLLSKMLGLQVVTCGQGLVSSSLMGRAMVHFDIRPIREGLPRRAESGGSLQP
ncbi:hypothetical protein GQ607_003471, partial [Colletotrichum asianum]